MVRIWVRFFLTRLRPTRLSQHFHNILSIPESNQVCPDYGEGIYDEFSQDMIDTFASFTLAYSSSFLLLEDDNGSSECYPFAESVGPLEGYAESSYPQCVRPETTETSVCAIEYTTLADSPESCPDRRYALATYPSQQEAEAAGAIVTHGGGMYLWDVMILHVEKSDWKTPSHFSPCLSCSHTSLRRL